MNYSSWALVSLESLLALEESLDGERALSRGFVGRYVEMWPARHARLCDALSEGNWGAATESALSLFSSSAMVGADRLGQMAGDLVELLKQGRHTQAASIIVPLGVCGNETVEQLLERYVRQPA